MTKEKEKNGHNLVREINLQAMTVSVHLLSTHKNEGIDFLLDRGLGAIATLKKNEGKE